MNYLTLSKNVIQSVRRLEQRKFRREEGAFLAEGNKLVEDNLSAMHCRKLIATEAWWAAHPEAVSRSEQCYVARREELERVSLLQTPQEVLGVFSIPDFPLQAEALRSSLSVVLDDVQDPGNVGTIIRLCDWFGIEQVICSPGTADCYSPKVVQASMGAVCRIRVHYTPLVPFLSELKGLPIYGTYLSGENIYRTELSPVGLIVMGNEGKGISAELAPLITHRLTIPSFALGTTSESLNVGVATAIIASEFRRRKL
jgi:TrmH family RNA methyltransferase